MTVRVVFVLALAGVFVTPAALVAQDPCKDCYCFPYPFEYVCICEAGLPLLEGCKAWDYHCTGSACNIARTHVLPMLEHLAAAPERRSVLEQAVTAYGDYVQWTEDRTQIAVFDCAMDLVGVVPVPRGTQDEGKHALPGAP